MIKTINFTTSEDDTLRFDSPDDLRNYYQSFGCDGLELMNLGTDQHHIIENDMVIGVHLNCPSDWMQMDPDVLYEHYRKELDYAQSLNARYVVFHVTQVSLIESMTYRLEHTSMEVIDAVLPLINRLLDNQAYSFYFLMENLWWPGLDFLSTDTTQHLLEGVHYSKKGFMFDTGHFMSTNRSLRTIEDAVFYLKTMLQEHKKWIPYIYGIHLSQSLSGEYLEQYFKNPPALSDDSDTRFCQMFEHIFKIDQHKPFCSPKLPELIAMINPEYVTYEFITENRAQHEEYMKKAIASFS
ncbi:MAG: TIM barrel protein [Eubacteriales bacterium]|nr:TIM barrel protein [Eubacteriales bacterium]